MTQRQDKPTLNARTHPDDRARIAALNAVGQTLRGATPEKPPTSYYTPLLIQCTLPHSDPKTDVWVRKNGGFSLIVSTGHSAEGKSFGVPYGSFPRLTLAYIITEVKETGKRRLELSASFGGFLREIGYTGNLRGSTRASKTIQGQLLRLLKPNISFERTDGTALCSARSTQASTKAISSVSESSQLTM